MNKKLTEKGFSRLVSDPCAYRREINREIEFVTVWVDDLMLFANGEEAMNRAKTDLQGMFEVTDLGEPSKIVGIEITIDPKTGDIKLTQTKYIEELLRKYGLVDANGVAVPMDPNIKFEYPRMTSTHGSRFAIGVSLSDHKATNSEFSPPGTGSAADAKPSNPRPRSSATEAM